jgi:hypothetical protein
VERQLIAKKDEEIATLTEMLINARSNLEAA